MANLYLELRDSGIYRDSNGRDLVRTPCPIHEPIYLGLTTHLVDNTKPKRRRELRDLDESLREGANKMAKELCGVDMTENYL